MLSFFKKQFLPVGLVVAALLGMIYPDAVSYTHLTLPTNREV